MQILRSLTYTALFLNSFTVAENINVFSSPPLSIASEPYTLNLSCAECAFSYSECLENVNPAFLTITFSTENDTLLANNDIIFPTSWPMRFHAPRKQGSLIDSVPLAYALDVSPLPHQPGAILGDLYHLTLTLVDLQGRRATEHPVSIGIVRDINGDLQIIQVEESWHRYHRHLHQAGAKSKGKDNAPKTDAQSKKPSWWRMEAWKEYYNTHFQKPEREPCTSGSASKPGQHCTPSAGDHQRLHHDHRQRLDDWIYDKHFHSKFAGPAVVSGLLGVCAAFLAGALGFFVGKVIVSLYCYLVDRARVQTVTGRGLDEERYMEEVAELEKKRLAQMEKQSYAFGHQVVEKN
ncbi:predicted protein [Aspergillus nidulans FGSC A4]|nr:predicted protein [Aspergillus nidulans FGSC A4]|eukprot:XP_662976.1 predicted protein [Aspergillus nidulans FGSC A4]